MTEQQAGPVELGESFPLVTRAQWRALVERDLQGAPFEKKLVAKTFEGVDVQPLYTAEDEVPPAATGLPGAPPRTRGGGPLGAGDGGWVMAQDVVAPEPGAANAALREDLARGAAGVVVRLDRTTRLGLEPAQAQARPGGAVDPGGGVLLTDVADLDALLAGVDLAHTWVAFDPCGSALPLAAALAAVAGRRGVLLTALRGNLGMDPLTGLARDGALPCDLAGAYRQAVDLAAWAAAEAPGLRALTVATNVWHDGGATGTEELAFALATGVTYLRRLTDGGLPLAVAAGQVGFTFAVGRDLFLEVAKLRAARRLWALTLAAAGGGAAAQRTWIHARASSRTKTARDPWVNLLRTTVECFAAAVGGADVVTTTPFDDAVGPPDEFARRIALNTQTVLRHESHLARVVDPAGGSWAVERLTDELARAAWKRFQAIEAAGGMERAVLTGRARAEVEAAAEERRRAVAKRREAITGVNEFPHVAEARVERPRPERSAVLAAAAARAVAQAAGGDAAAALAALAAATAGGAGGGALTRAACAAAAAGATLGGLRAGLPAGGPVATAPAVPIARDAALFEELRDAADAHAVRTGARPRVFLAVLRDPRGPIPQHGARAGFSRNLFEAGGFEVLTNDGFADAAAAAAAFAASGAEGAAICSSDAAYPEVVPDLARALTAGGARFVALAGRPGEHEAAWRAAGVGVFVFLGCDAHAVLRGLLVDLGALPAAPATAPAAPGAAGEDRNR
jgi:methylmalonyl-CoA mutase